MLRPLGYLTLGWILLHAGTAAAQTAYPDPALERPLRIEIPVTSDNSTYRVIPCSGSGMLLFFKSTESSGDREVKWYFTLYDRNLQKSWTKSVPLKSEMDYENSSPGGDTLSLFFQSDGKDRSLPHGFQLLRIVLSKEAFILNNGGLPEGASMAVFNVVHQKCVVGLNLKNEQAQLMVLDLPSGKQDFVPILGGTQTSFSTMEVDPGDMTVTLVIRKQLTKRIWDHYFLRMNLDGTVIGESLIATMTPERQLAESRILTLSPGEKLVAGSYILTSSMSDQQREKGTSKATGFFTARVSGTTQKEIQFSNFLDMKSADHFLGEREILALRKKAIRKSRIAPEYSTDLNLLVHDIIPHGEQYILLGEAYYLQYHTESFTDYDYYGRPYSNSYSVFDGYRFTNAIVAAFDSDGKLLWDNFMEVRNLVTQNLDPKISCLFDDEQMILAYLSDGKIGYKVIQGENTVEKTDYTEVDLLLPEDRLVNETRSRMVGWYDNFFICYGYQEIKNLAATGNANKLVFYCNKVRFD